MRLIVLTIVSYICFGFLLDVSTQNAGNAELMDADLVKSIQGELETLTSNYHNLLLTVQNDRSEIDFLIKQNQDLNQRLNKTVDKMEKLVTNEESLTQKIQALQKITSQQQQGATDLQKVTRDVIELNTKVTKLESSTDNLLSNITLMSSKLEHTVNDVTELNADETAMALFIEQSSLINSLITFKLQKMTDDVMKSTTKVTKLESTTDKLLSNLTLMSSKIEKNFKDVEELKADEAAVDSFMKLVTFNNTLITSKLQKMTGDVMESITTRNRVTKLESSTDKLLPILILMSSKIEKNFKDLQELKSDAELSCRSEKFTCTNQFQCIHASRKCDGFADCSDRTDEEGCGCKSNEFTCKSGNCIPDDHRCDRNIDCNDGSDELNCPIPITISINPKKLTKMIGSNANFRCNISIDGTPLKWNRHGKIDIQPKSTVKRGRLTIPDLDIKDAGKYICSGTYNNRTYTEFARLKIRRLQESGQPSRETGVTIRGPGQRTVREGETVTIECDTTGIQNAVVRWRKRNGLMPPNHSVRGGTLTIPNFRSVYSGEYICSASSPVKNYETSVFIIVTVTPSLTISPARVEARAGGTVQLRCQPQGTGPFNIEWLKVDGVLNLSATQTRDGLLEIRQVTAADSGRYRCLATGSSGSSDGFAIVSVTVPPTITLSQRNARPYLGQLMELRCQASGNPPPSITWEKENGVLPRDHTVNNGVLQIFNVRQEDSGRYICQAASPAGIDREYVTLTVQGRNTDGNGPIRIETQTVNIGERVEMECVVTGTPIPTVTWSRIREPLPETSTVNDVFLVIPNVRIEDDGAYVCTAQNLRGTIQQRVYLFVKD